MLGETTLAMLYVPLFFYIFDRINERKRAKEEKAARPAGGTAPAAAPHAPREGD
jgi:multidrug efflux pump